MADAETLADPKASMGVRVRMLFTRRCMPQSYSLGCIGNVGHGAGSQLSLPSRYAFAADRCSLPDHGRPERVRRFAATSSTREKGSLIDTRNRGLSRRLPPAYPYS